MIRLGFARERFMVSAARRRLIAATSAILVVCASVLASRASAGLAIDQRSTGLPGSSTERPREQKLLIGSGAIRIEDRTTGRSLIIRLDKGVVWEVDPKLEMYTETTFEHFRDLRREAEKRREEAYELIVKKHAEGKLPDAEFRRELAEKNLRADGKRIVTVERAPAVLDGERVERVAVELNGVTQVAVWQTDRYKDQYRPPQELFDFYDKCQFLPDDVTAALRKAVTLFPVRIFADIDYYSAGQTLETWIKSVSEWPEDPTKFEGPGAARGFKRVKEFPKEQIAKREYRCPICGKLVDPATTPYPPAKDKKTGEKVYFDSQDHWEEFLNRRP
jgi:hypothetical protein